MLSIRLYNYQSFVLWAILRNVGFLTAGTFLLRDQFFGKQHVNILSRRYYVFKTPKSLVRRWRPGDRDMFSVQNALKYSLQFSVRLREVIKWVLINVFHFLMLVHISLFSSF